MTIEGKILQQWQENLWAERAQRYAVLFQDEARQRAKVRRLLRRPRGHWRREWERLRTENKRIPLVVIRGED